MSDDFEAQDGVFKEILSHLVNPRPMVKSLSKKRVNMLIKYYFADNDEFLANYLKFRQDWVPFRFTIDRKTINQQLKEHSAKEFHYNYTSFGPITDHYNNTNKYEELTSEEFQHLTSKRQQQEQQEHQQSKDSSSSVKFRLDFDKTVHSMPKDSCTNISSINEDSVRNATILNVNGIITSLTWLNQDPYHYVGHDNYLCVAVYPKHPDQQYKFIDGDLSIFKYDFSGNKDTKDGAYSFIKIFKYNSQTQHTEPAFFWAFDSWGPVREMKSVPVLSAGYGANGEQENKHKQSNSSNKDSQLGLLGALFADGGLRFLNLDVNGPQYAKINKPAIEIKLKAPHVITSFDYIDSETVVVATDTGYIAEFDINYSQPKPKPAYFVPKHDLYIRKILVQPAVPNFCNTLIYTFSQDGLSKITDRENVYAAKHSGSVRRLAYINNVFEVIPTLYGVGQPYNNLSQIHNPKTWGATAVHLMRNLNFTQVLSLGSSHLHPFTLAGDSAGEVVMSNTIDMPSANFQRGGAPVKQVVLWRFEYNENLQMYKIGSQFSLRMFHRTTKGKVGELGAKRANNSKSGKGKGKGKTKGKGKNDADIAAGIEENGAGVALPSPLLKENIKGYEELYDEVNFEPTRFILYPPEVSISHLKWCENVESCNVYAASLPCDVVIIDKIATVEEIDANDDEVEGNEEKGEENGNEKKRAAGRKKHNVKQKKKNIEDGDDGVTPIVEDNDNDDDKSANDNDSDEDFVIIEATGDGKLIEKKELVGS